MNRHMTNALIVDLPQLQLQVLFFAQTDSAEKKSVTNLRNVPFVGLR